MLEIMVIASAPAFIPAVFPELFDDILTAPHNAYFYHPLTGFIVTLIFISASVSKTLGPYESRTYRAGEDDASAFYRYGSFHG